MNHAALFNGEGGFQLAASWMGWENYMSSEIDNYCNHLTKRHYPNCIQHHDIRTTDFTVYRGVIDIVTGGFPCQPFSVAGEQQGTDDPRYLWPEMFRTISEIQPRWAVCENVYGLVSWNGGMVFDKVQSDLESIGYQVAKFVLPAASVNAPHKRDRVWFVAYAANAGVKGVQSRRENSVCKPNPITNTFSERCDNRSDYRQERHIQDDIGTSKEDKSEWERWKCWISEISEAASNASGKGLERGVCGNSKLSAKRIKEGVTSNTESFRLQSAGGTRTGREGLENYDKRSDWSNFPTQSPVCTGNDGLPTELVRQFIRDDSNGILSEKEIDQIISAAISKWRKEVIKMGGNAIVPQVAYQIFKAIRDYEMLHD